MAHARCTFSRGNDRGGRGKLPDRIESRGVDPVKQRFIIQFDYYLRLSDHPEVHEGFWQDRTQDALRVLEVSGLSPDTLRLFDWEPTHVVNEGMPFSIRGTAWVEA